MISEARHGCSDGPCPNGLRTFVKKSFSASISHTSISFAPLNVVVCAFLLAFGQLLFVQDDLDGALQ